jgi:hypothetical protein
VYSGNVEQIKNAYPGLPENQRRSWQQQFGSWKPERVELSQVRGISGPDAAGVWVVEFVMQVSFSDRNTGTPVASRPSRYRATLKREGPTSILQALSEVTGR